MKATCRRRKRAGSRHPKQSSRASSSVLGLFVLAPFVGEFLLGNLMVAISGDPAGRMMPFRSGHWRLNQPIVIAHVTGDFELAYSASVRSGRHQERLVAVPKVLF
jgi:hypothetical protein